MPGKRALQAISQRPLLILISAGLMFAACGNGLDANRKAEQTDPSGLLSGVVTRGPLSPVIDPNTPLSAPSGVPGVRVIVSRLDTKEIFSTLTDARGAYSFKLGPSTYRLALGELPGGALSKDVPATVTVEAQKETRFDIRLDSRLR